MLLRDNIYQVIRRAILTCELRPGQELREQVLAQHYHVSRSPIRDSLLRLEQENLVTVLPRQGYRVKPISISDVEDILGLRLLIEPACAAAAARADDTALGALEQFRGFADDEWTQSGFVNYNKAFHRMVAELSGNGRMAAIAFDLDEQFQRLVQVSLDAFKYEQVDQACGEHDAIIDALQAHDAGRASRLSYEHAVRGHERIVAALGLARS